MNIFLPISTKNPLIGTQNLMCQKSYTMEIILISIVKCDTRIEKEKESQVLLFELVTFLKQTHYEECSQ